MSKSSGLNGLRMFITMFYNNNNKDDKIKEIKKRIN